MVFSSYAAVLLAIHTIHALPVEQDNKAVALTIPSTAAGGSIAHDPSFSSFSFEPAFWVEFFGNLSTPNDLTFTALNTIIEHGGQPIIRPGGDTMDSMIFDPSVGNPVRDESPTGGVWRTTVGPAYYKSWSNFPSGTKFISTLNFENDSYSIALDMALASVKYQRAKIAWFELGNEPTNYPESRWNDSTLAYVEQWKNWTLGIDAAVNATLSSAAAAKLGAQRWWASSATTDDSGLNVRPADIIPLGVDSADQVAEYSIHSYPFSTCDPTRAALATIPNILNHTGLTSYAVTEIGPSATAAQDAGSRWVVGEFNSVSCSGNPGVTNTFAQALWVIDSELIYATMNASSVHLHQGATLVLQSSDQVNTPGFSTYDMLYPQYTDKWGDARALPSFAGQLFMAEAFATSGTRVMELATPVGVDPDYFAAYALYVKDQLNKLAILNLNAYYANSTSDSTVKLDISSYTSAAKPTQQAFVKRLTAPYVDELNTTKVTWAGQHFPQGTAKGAITIEEVGTDGIVKVRGSEAVLVFFGDQEIYGA